ncbi:putative reverse transcriptase domain-containing protein [Tanacetum coccineum]|uniref:Reverse transcriptase domain-containing protein n=1 Tax=Tanacetum coccineum TaxID=301880 RepID=A0ABQ5GJ35_9ASTR
MANPPPNDLNANLPEDEPVQPEHAPVMLRFAPAILNIPNNNNGWIEEDDEEEMEAEEDDEEEMEAEDDDVIDVEVNDDKDDAEVIYPYEEANPLNRPPIGSDDETESTIAAPVTSYTLRPIPPIHQFTGSFYVGEGSSARALLADNGRVYAPGPMGCNMKTLHSKVKTLDKQMSDRYNNEFRWATVREQGSDHSEMVQIVEGLSRQFKEFKESNAYREIKTLREELRATQNRAEEQLPEGMRFREVHHGPSTGSTPVPHSDEPYAIVKDVVTSVARDDGDDPAVPSDPHSSQPRGSPSIATERERVRNERPAGGPAQGPATAPPVREWNKVMFAAATFQGRALTWWNSQVATLGLEVANGESWTEMKTMLTEEFCPPEQIQRMESELWNLKVKDYDITAYTARFNELVLLCPEMVPTEKKKIGAYIRGLSDNIKGEVTSS